MKKSTEILSVLLLLLAIYWVFKSMMPGYTRGEQVSETAFSTDRALLHIKKLSEAPHGVGFTGHKMVREYIVEELDKMGLESQLQQGYTAGDWANFSEAVNILARIKGSGDGKALLLLSHYDSSPHSSLGASDAGSGVATILEGVRAFLSAGKTPLNDVIILFTDAEELGLNGADLFVNKHPWAKEIGLVLNFEARGSGGPGYMLIETNQGNTRLIKEFTAANPKYPVANSLAYSIYKMLPNDTDLTVFREDADIDGLNFAFIDDHFDYHTVKDDFERLDRTTLAHQGSYLMPLLSHFSKINLNDLKSAADDIYFNMPFFRLVSYPFTWIWPLYFIALGLFIVLLITGFQRKMLQPGEIAKSFIPLLTVLLINGLLGYYSWPLLKWLYPQYQDILQGFTYNGHAYIAAFAALATAVCFWTFQSFRRLNTQHLLVAAITFWLVVCAATSVYLPGAAFILIPVYSLLAALMVYIDQPDPNVYLMVVLAVPALWIFAPLIQMFPVGLGLKMMIAATLVTTMVFLLLLPLFGTFRRKSGWGYIGLLLFVGCMVFAHFKADFSKDRAKPTSLIYILDADSNTAQWATYEHVLSPWTSQYLGTGKSAPETASETALSSKYATAFTKMVTAPIKEIPAPDIIKSRDTVIGESRLLDLVITPKRAVNRLEIFTETKAFSEVHINQIPLPREYLETRSSGKLLTHFISNNNETRLSVIIPKDEKLELTLFEASNDLLTNPLFSVPPRPDDAIPMPFVLNDAVVVRKTIRF